MAELINRLVANRYRVESFLGKGGMAEVYKVWDESRSVPLAMKILHADMSEDKVFLRRFKREAQTLEKMQHPNIVRFYGLEQSDGLVFLLMEYVEGVTLRKEIFETDIPFSLERVLNVMQPVTAALHYAHQSGFVHCDVKPANIMLHKNGNILVADFGIARMSETATVTMAGAGTPAYMSPEQIKGDAPTPQMDVYALGIILFEMLTGGERPFIGEKARFTGTTAEKVRWEQRNLEAPSPREYNHSISPALEKVVLTCLQKESENRYKSALDVYAILKKISDAAGAPPQISEEEIKENLNKIENQALQYEALGNFNDALRLYYEIKRINPLFPHVNAKINQLEEDIKPKQAQPVVDKPVKPRNSPKPAARKSPKPNPKEVNDNPLFALLRYISGLSQSTSIMIGVLFIAIMLFFMFQSPPSPTVEGNYGVYFSSDRTGKLQIYHIGKNGKVQQVTKNNSNNFEAIADGLGIYFTSDRTGKNEIFYLSNSGEVKQVTHSSDANSSNPVSYGSGAYFVSDLSGKKEVYYVNASGIKQITDTPDDYISLDPAPTSKGLYFSSNRSNGKFEIFFMAHATGKITQVTYTKTSNAGSQQAAAYNNGFYYVSNRDGENFEIYYMDSQGGVTQVTKTSEDVINLNPVPVSSGLYFVSNRTGVFEVYHLDAKGDLIQVTHSPENSFSAIGPFR